MIFAVETAVAASPEAAFDAMADARNETRWNSQVSRAELLSDEPVRAGSRFETVNRGQTYLATITTYDRPARLVFDVTGKALDIGAEFDFAPAGDRTRVSARLDFRPKGVVRAMFALMTPAVRRDLPTQLDSFRAMCESGAAAPR